MKKDYSFSTFFSEICSKQGIDPLTKKQTCLQWMDNSRLNKLNNDQLMRLAANIEDLDVKMYQLPSIRELIDFNRALEKDSAIGFPNKCSICNNMRFILLVNINNGEESASRCECMLPYDHNNKFVYAKELLDSGEYVTEESYSRRNRLTSMDNDKIKKFIKRIFKKNNIPLKHIKT